MFKSIEYGIFVDSENPQFISGFFSTIADTLSELNNQIFTLHNPNPDHFIICSVEIKANKFNGMSQLKVVNSGLVRMELNLHEGLL